MWPIARSKQGAGAKTCGKALTSDCIGSDRLGQRYIELDPAPYKMAWLSDNRLYNISNRDQVIDTTKTSLTIRGSCICISL